MSGRDNMLGQPEFSDINRLKELMKVLDNGRLFHQWTDQADNVAVQIGTRNELIQIGDCSVVTTSSITTMKKKDNLWSLALIECSIQKSLALMDYMSNVIEDVFGNGKGGKDGE